MAPMKFEEQLKEKLEQRKLQPSIDAWNKLSNKLETNESTKRSNNFWWLGIAASFVGVLIIIASFYNNDKTKITAPTIVDIEQPKAEEKELDKQKDSNKEHVAEIEVIEKKEPVKNTPLDKKSKAKTPLKQKQEALIKTNVTDVFASVDNQQELKKDSMTSEPDSNAILSFEDKKILEVVAQVEQLQKRNQKVTDDEINALLDAAQKEIMLNRIMSTDGKKVDAMALLESVEMDIEEESFRDRAFKAIKEGYKYVKTAVAERNN